MPLGHPVRDKRTGEPVPWNDREDWAYSVAEDFYASSAHLPFSSPKRETFIRHALVANDPGKLAEIIQGLPPVGGIGKR